MAKYYVPIPKYHMMQLAILQIYILNLNTTFLHRKTIPITFEQGCTCCFAAVLECRHQGQALDYQGTVTNTISGRTCQRWDSQSPHRHVFGNPNKFPDFSVDENGNYCRNPDAMPDGPWCFTIDPSVRWEYCSLDFCLGNGVTSIWSVWKFSQVQV